MKIAFVILSILLLITTPATSFAEDHEFIRGIWHCWNSGCVGERTVECCVDELWGQDTIPPWDRTSLEEINANNLHSHYYGEDDVLPVLNYCNSTGGAVKIYIGLESRFPTWQDYSQFVNWCYVADDYNQSYWKEGVHETLMYYDSVFNYFGQVGLRGIYMNSESWPDTLNPNTWNYYRGWAAMIDSIQNHDQNHDLIIAMTGLARRYQMDSLTTILSELDVFEEDSYMFGYDLALDYFYDEDFQVCVDWLFQQYSEFVWEKVKNTDIEWMPVIWVAARAIPGENCGDSGFPILTHRWPTREEIRLQAFLALAAGAKGIVVFSYATVEDLSGEKIWGLLDYDRDPANIKTIPQNHDDSLSSPYTGYFGNYGNLTPYDHVAELFDNLEDWGPYFLPLWVDQHYAQTDDLPDSSDILKEVSGDYIAGSTMTDTSRWEETRYFMLVNRRTSSCSNYGCPADSQIITIKFRMPESDAYILTSMFDEKYEIFTSVDSTVSSYNYYHFVDTIGPGDGKLYRIHPDRHGSLTENTTFYEREIISDDLSIANGKTLTVNSGSKVYILPDESITFTIYGFLSASGTSSDSIWFLPYDATPSQGDWDGFYVEEDVDIELKYCSIQFGDIGIKMETNSQVALDHCNIVNNSTSGIYNYRGFLFLNNCEISGNGVYGLDCFNSCDSVINSTFGKNGSYGIRINGSNSSNDESYINKITVDYDEDNNAQYGIYVINNDYISIDSSEIQDYYQGGIKLEDSECDITETHLIQNNFYGIYTYDSSPTIRYCVFDDVSIGYKNVMPGISDLGDTSTTDGNNSFLDCDSLFIHFSGIQSGTGVDTLFAQKNWWGDSTGPSSSKLYVGDRRTMYIQWHPHLIEHPSAKLLAQLPLKFSLNQNYPNPFNAKTKISFTLSSPAYTKISIYNILGQKTKMLLDEYLLVGNHVVEWDGTNTSDFPVASGIYFYTIQSGDNFDSKKMLLLR